MSLEIPEIQAQLLPIALSKDLSCALGGVPYPIQSAALTSPTEVWGEPRSIANVAIVMLTKVLSEARNTVSLDKLIYVLKVRLLLL